MRRKSKEDYEEEKKEEERRGERHRVNNKRKNIKMVKTSSSLNNLLTALTPQVMRDERLGSVTKTARAEEEERLARLARLHQEELPRYLKHLCNC